MRNIIVYGRKSEQKNTKTDAARLPPAARPRSLPMTTGVVRTSKYWRSRDWLTASKKWKPKDMSSVVRMTGTKEGKKPVSAVPRPVASAGYRSHPVLFHDEEQGDDQKSEQSRHFAQRLHKAVVRRRKMGAFHREVRVEECPPLIAERRAQRQEEQEKVHARVRAPAVVSAETWLHP